MQYLPFLLLPFVFAATRSLTLGVPSIVPAEKEYEFLTVVIFSLLGLLVALSLMVRFPDLGAVIGEYNQFWS
jgi:hypothetical protein